MGCGGSKFDTEGDAVPVRVRPIMRRRIEEVRKRRNTNGLKDSTPSKKELLCSAGEEHDNNNSISPPHSPREDGNKRVSSPDSDNIIKEHVFQEDISLKPKKEESKTRDNEKTDEVKSMAKYEEDEDDDDGEGEYDEEGMLCHEEGCLCPGSPSFRVYYVESITDKNDNDDDRNKNEGAINESSQGDESVASRNSTEGSVTKITKNGKKGTRFGRAMQKGGHVAVKNLLSVKSRYHPAASSHDNTRLLQKAAA